MASTCGICLESYTKKNRVKVVCQYCPVGACRPCQQNYLLSTYSDPHCFTCKQGWSTEFMTANFPIIFRTKTLRMHRRKILLEREKSLLPTMQIFVEAKRNMAVAQQKLDPIFTEYYKKATDLQTMRFNTVNLKEQLARLHTKLEAKKLESPTAEELAPYEADYKKMLDVVAVHERKIPKYIKDEFGPAAQQYDRARRLVAQWQNVYDTGQLPVQGAAEEKKERREFIMRCPADDCRGFLSTAYKCGVCDKKTCSECLEVLTEGEHTCKPDAVETAKAIKKETRPCPKCGVRIYKIDGCDQMWCTLEGCGTAFSWISGQVVTGRVHNPHYYEWLRRNGGGTAPREPGDIPCGGIPNVNDIYVGFRTHPVLTHGHPMRMTLYEIHRNVTEFQERLRDYPAAMPALYNKEINVQYLMNVITEERWQQLLEHHEAKFNRKKEIGQILQTLVIAASDVLRDFCTRAGYLPTDLLIEWYDKEVAVNLESLRCYTNETFKKLSHSTRMAVPQIGDMWAWVPIRAIYKNAIVDEDGAEVEEPVPLPV